MTHPHDLSLTPLARRALLSLEGGSGQGVGVFGGSVWITEEGLFDDHVLGPGESMVLRRPGLVIVEALQDSQVILFDTGASAARSRANHGAAPASAAGGTSGHTSVHASVHGARRVGGQATGAGEPQRPSLDEYERMARDLRRQAMAAAVSRLVQAIGRLLLRPTAPSTTPPSTPPALPRPGRPALAWQPQR